MAEYIDKEKAKEEFSLNFGGVSHAIIANRILDSLPIVDVEPVCHAKWIEDLEISYDGSCNGIGYHCSNCSDWTYETSNYCPNCGATMDGEIGG